MPGITPNDWGQSDPVLKALLRPFRGKEGPPPFRWLRPSLTRLLCSALSYHLGIPGKTFTSQS
jgi:hypothetical protein